MNETEWQKGRLEALSPIARAVVTAHKVEKPGVLGPTLIHLANEYLLDTPFDTQTPDFRSGFARVAAMASTKAAMVSARAGTSPRSPHQAPNTTRPALMTRSVLALNAPEAARRLFGHPSANSPQHPWFARLAGSR